MRKNSKIRTIQQTKRIYIAKYTKQLILQLLI